MLSFTTFIVEDRMLEIVDVIQNTHQWYRVGTRTDEKTRPIRIIWMD